MKKLTSILLLTIFLFSSIGYYLLFDVRYLNARNSMKKLLKSNLTKDQLTVISLSDSELTELRWKEDHEFYYKGSLFDVVRSYKSAGKTIYYCINDDQEEKLFSELDEMIARQQGDKSKCKEQKSDKEFVMMCSLLPFCKLSGIQAPKCLESCFIHSCELNPESPPPRFS